MAGQTFYRLYCDYCGYNKVTEGGQDCKGLVEYKRSPIQRGIPQYDPAKKQMVAKDPIHLPKQFKCPGCGRLIRARKLSGQLATNDNSKSEGWLADVNPGTAQVLNERNKSEGNQAGNGGPSLPGESTPYPKI